jgi:trehalose utilization protein
MKSLRVTVWNEFVHERENPVVAQIYPNGIHETIAASLRHRDGLEVRTAILQDPAQGLPPEVLDGTDVLIWWGHAAHE